MAASGSAVLKGEGTSCFGARGACKGGGGRDRMDGLLGVGAAGRRRFGAVGEARESPRAWGRGVAPRLHAGPGERGRGARLLPDSVRLRERCVELAFPVFLAPAARLEVPQDRGF